MACISRAIHRLGVPLLQVCDAILPVGPGQGGLHADRDSYFAALAEDAGFYIHEPLRVGVTDDIVAASMLDPS